MKPRNHTPFPMLVFESHTVDDEPFHVVVSRMTLRLEDGRVLRLAREQTPLQLAEVFRGEPGASSPVFESDLAPYKPFTDVTVVGDACAPGGEALPSWETLVRVGPVAKRLRVTGPRGWERDGDRWRLTDPTPVDRVPLCYELAHGGVVRRGDRAETCARNPVGVGFATPWSVEDVDRFEAPRIESADAPLSDPFAEPAPVGYGPIGRAWEPRLSLAGTYDDAWVKSTWPVLPKDFRSEYWNGAHPDLTVRGLLRSDAEIELVGLLPDGPLRCRLPGHGMFTLLRYESGEIEMRPMELDTVVIDLAERLVYVTSRAVVRQEPAVRVGELRMHFNDPDPQEYAP